MTKKEQKKEIKLLFKLAKLYHKTKNQNKESIVYEELLGEYETIDYKPMTKSKEK